MPFSHDIILFPPYFTLELDLRNQGLLFETNHIAHDSPDTCHLTSILSQHTWGMDSNLDILNTKFQPVLAQKKSPKFNNPT